MHHDATSDIFRYAEELRNNMTEAEQILWEALRKKQLNGMRFRRQHPINKYVLDFYCFKKKLSIELDGKYHAEKAQQFYDEDRTKNLAALGIREIRFSNEEVMNDLKGVLERIKQFSISKI